MPGVIFPLFGPLAINSYGFFIAIGLIIFTYLLIKDSIRPQLISTDHLYNALSLSILIAVIGGRLLFVFTEQSDFTQWYDFFALWQGGFSVLGAIIALLVTMPLYLYFNKIRAIALFDRAAIYAPLLQSISRIGCFFAGCCFGKTCSTPWAIIVQAATGSIERLHPTQLYSSLFLFIIFLCMVWRSQRPYKTGQLLSLYLMCIGVERFVVDIWRNDQTLWLKTSQFFLSINQTIAIFLTILGLVGYWWTSKQPNLVLKSKL